MLLICSDIQNIVMHKFQIALIIILQWLSGSITHGQLLTNTDASYADQLRGGQRKERWCYDVHYYDLSVRIDTATKSISGITRIDFTANEDFNTLQVDLFDNMDILNITHAGTSLKYSRQYNAVFVTFPEIIRKGSSDQFQIEFRGKPRIAKRAPWDGGFTWTHDKNGLPWIAVSCQGIGASLWWPNKDDLSDEPDSMRIHCTVPNPLRCVANGQEEPPTSESKGFTTYHWKVSYPINNYNVSLNIAQYTHWSDTYTAADGDILALDYYVLPYNESLARKQFTQVKPMLACYEKYLGKYPFWKDGYALVETPYLGMEHQSAVAYGNNYNTGYAGMDRSGLHLDFDYIIIHETGHEWWGNSVSAQDLADMWIHESFCTYSEAIYVECMHGYDTAMTYVNAMRTTVGNLKPIIGIYGLNKEGDADMYVKGMLFLNTLRHVVNNDDLWWSTIKNMSDTTFRMRTTNYQEVVQFMNKKTKLQLTPIFEQYVKWPTIPILQYKIKTKKNETFVKYRWKTNAKNFAMPFVMRRGNNEIRVENANQKWKCISIAAVDPQEKITIDTRHFYIHPVELPW